MRVRTISKWVSLCLVLLFVSSCHPTPGEPPATPTLSIVISTQTDLPASSEPTQDTAETQEDPSTDSDDEATPQALPDPLDNLLALRSLKIKLAGLLPDGTSRSMEVEIDPLGNMRVQTTHPPIPSTTLPEGVTLPKDSNSSNIYVVNGLVYTPSADDPEWQNNPVEMDYAATLSEQMHGFEGFTTWLDLLPAGSLTAAGDEAVGSFSTAKYLVYGKIGDQILTGSLWYDISTHSLVKAELHVPAVLTSNPEAPESGETFITLSAEMVESSPISLPTQ